MYQLKHFVKSSKVNIHGTKYMQTLKYGKSRNCEEYILVLSLGVKNSEEEVSSPK